MAESSLALRLLFFGLTCGQMWAAAPIPFVTLYRKADVVFVGSVESVKLLPTPSARVESPPEQSVLDLYPCELTIGVEAPLKPAELIEAMGATAQIVYYLPSRHCDFDYLGDDLTGHMVWLLRYENGGLRALVDKPSTIRRLRTFSPDLAAKMRQWGDPDLPLTYLLLKPGVVRPEIGYADHPRPDDLDIVGFSDLLRVYQTLFLDSGTYLREQISLDLASFAQCLPAARQTAQTAGRLKEWTARNPFLNSENNLQEEARLSHMWWTTKEQLLNDFGNEKNAVDELTLWACSSFPRVRARARDLLSRYLGIDPPALPCVPCQ